MWGRFSGMMDWVKKLSSCCETCHCWVVFWGMAYNIRLVSVTWASWLDCKLISILPGFYDIYPPVRTCLNANCSTQTTRELSKVQSVEVTLFMRDYGAVPLWSHSASCHCEFSSNLDMFVANSEPRLQYTVLCQLLCPFASWASNILSKHQSICDWNSHALIHQNCTLWALCSVNGDSLVSMPHIYCIDTR